MARAGGEREEGESRRRPRILLGVSGSVATVKVPELALRLAEFAEVRVVLTSVADRMLPIAESYAPSHWAAWMARGGTAPVLRDADEWDSYRVVGRDPVLHIELRKWADLFLVAPLSANTLAKLAHGLADNLLTCVARAWDFGRPMLVAPAMNTLMWSHPFTAHHLRTLEDLGVRVVPPKGLSLLACGDAGAGALAAVDDLVAHVRVVLSPLFPALGAAGASEAVETEPGAPAIAARGAGEAGGAGEGKARPGERGGGGN